jgi:hypothetical protein
MPRQLELEPEILSAVRSFANSINGNRKVVGDMSLLVNATSHLPLKNLDYWERFLRWEFRKAMDTSKPPKWKFWERPSPFLTWIDLCSGDGYERERTLRTISGAAPNSFFLALAVRRLNDWVAQVREAAREKLIDIAQNSDPEHVVDVLCFTLPNWTSWGRLEALDRQILVEITTIEKVVLSLKSRIILATSGPMAAILAQAGRADSLDSYMHEIATSAIQPSVRAKAYQCLLEKKMVWIAGQQWKWIDKQYCKGRFQPILRERPLSVVSPFVETLKLAVNDRSPMVRRVAGDALIRELKSIGAEAIKFAESLSRDPSPSVAERGNYALGRLNDSS